MGPQQGRTSPSWREELEHARIIFGQEAFQRGEWFHETQTATSARAFEGIFLDQRTNNNITRNKKDKMLDKSILKQRHLNRDERADFHDPNPDWVNTPMGEVCRSACTLPIEDLIDNNK